MKLPNRLTSFTVIGMLASAAIGGDNLLMQFHGYDHGHGESLRCMLAGGLIGAFVGVGADLFLRLFDNDLRVSMKDVMQLTAGVAFAFGASVIALRFAASW
ncbi:MAG: hypothetical protein AB7V46_00110 [Thermomicrobiales bacterium]